MNSSQLTTLIAALWPDGDSLDGPQVHMLLDGARDPAIVPMLRFGKLEYSCLFSGELSPRLRAAAPYLVHLAASSPQTHELLRRGWNNSWGVITTARADVTIMQQRLHFKKLLRVQEEDGHMVAFRFYDPRVLRVYLPTCTAEEIDKVFGPVDRLIMETQDANGWLDIDRNGTRRHLLAQTDVAAPIGAEPVLAPQGAIRARANAVPSQRLAFGRAQLRVPAWSDCVQLAGAVDSAMVAGLGSTQTWVDQARERWTDSAAGPRDFVIVDPVSDKVIGLLSVAWHLEQQRVAELGYWVSPAARGRGIAGDAVRAAARWLLQDGGAGQIMLRMNHQNAASVRVAERCGFQLERACAGMLKYTLGPATTWVAGAMA